MTTDKVIVLINEFIDGELPKEKENVLFTELGINEIAREYFKKINSLKIVTMNQTETFPNELDKKILTKMQSVQPATFISKIKSGAASYISYALLLITLLTGYYIYEDANISKQQLELAKTRIEQQDNLLNVILTNQLAPITVKPEYENEIIIEARM